MNNIYIDVNAQNSKIETKENNIYEYQLPRPLNLPTGTEINIQNSLVNLQGITGASIEIQEDITEKLIYQYYVSDSTYQVPNRVIAPRNQDTIQFNIYSSADVHRNFNRNGNEFHPLIIPDEAQEVGYSETIMPLLTTGAITLDGEATETLTPLCGEVDIRIPKGIYSISEISTLITNQINGLGDTGSAQVEDSKANDVFRGQLYNGTTCRPIFVEDADFWVNQYAGTPQNITGLSAFAPLTKNDNVVPDAIAFTCATNNERLAEIRQGFLNKDDQGNNLSTITDLFGTQTSPNGRYNIVFRRINEPVSSEFPNGHNDPRDYNIFSQNNMGVGTSEFQLSYSTENSAFSIKNLHQPRKIPSHDRFGNTLQNSGQNVVYMKRLSTDVAGTPLIDPLQSTLNTPVQRFSGIMVFNWAYNTAKKLGVGIENRLKINKDKADLASKFFRFQDFFDNDEEAEIAWNTTIWARLGFSFNDIQAESSYTKGFIGSSEELSNGFTTGMEVDASAVPFISTIFNGISSVAPSQPSTDPTNRLIDLPKTITNIQLFNLFDSNVPQLPFNNNKTISPGLAVVAPYQSSFYTSAVMIPIQTDSFEVVASNLPVLSERGYLYVLSNMIEPNDIVKLKDEVGLLDQLPISNLSNQDFIADRTAIMHTLSNPKIINTIRIMVLNPDLTNVPLQPNSSFLIKVALPLPKSTNITANVEDNLVEQQVEANIIKQQKQAEKQAKKSTKL